MTSRPSSYAGFVCWDATAISDDIIPQEAVYPSDAVFAATHHPMTLRRSKFNTTETLSCDEDTLLEDIQAHDVTMLFLAIVGESGTGKSHLIRWLGTRLKSDKRRRVVYIKKYNTNLRDVVWEILSGIEGAEFDDLRTRIERATTDTTEEDAAEMLVDQLALLVSGTAIDGRQEVTERKRRELLAKDLPKLLRDDVYRKQLLTEGSAIRRLIHEVFQGRTQGDKLEPFEFTAADLPMAVTDIRSAGAYARAIYQSLVGNPPLRQAAAGLLNEFLERAIGRVLQVGDTTLTRAMIDLRKLLHQRKQELVLLIEDFTLLQGIQRGLLEALIEPAIRSGEKELCTIRTAVAVTTGYFEKLGFETIMTRADFAGYVYNVDQHYGTDLSEDQVDSFVGRYMNAARVGAPALESAFAARSRSSGQQWVPNKCDSCEFRAKCHASFGVTRDGFGLYPLNSHALDRMVREVGTRRDMQVFEPRAVLGAILRQTLAGNADDIVAGRFPSESYIARFGARREVPDEVRLQLRDQEDGDRLVGVHEYWATDGNVQPGVYEAFKIRPPRAGFVQTTQVPPPSRAPDDEKRAGPVPHIDPKLKAVDQWRGGAPLDARTAREVREAVKEAVAIHLVSELDCWRSGASADWGLKQGSVELANARGGVARASTDIELSIDDDERNMSAVRGLVSFSIHGNWGFQFGGDAFRNYLLLLDQLTSVVRNHIPQGKTLDSARGDQLDFLMAGGFVAGAASPVLESDTDVMRAIFADIPRSASTVGDVWDGLVDRYSRSEEPHRDGRQQELLDVYGASQGDGRPQLVDAAALLPRAHQFLRSWSLASQPGTEGTDDRNRQSSSIRETVLQQTTEWNNARARALLMFGEDLSINGLREEIARVIEHTRRLQILSNEDEIGGASELFGELSSLTTKELDALVSGAGDEILAKAVSALASMRNRMLMRSLPRLAGMVTKFVTETEARIFAELTNAKSDPAQVSFQRYRTSLDNLQRLVSAIK